MANTINNIKDVGTVIAKMAAGMLADQTQFLASIDKEPVESFSQVNGYNTGDTININKPARFIPSSTADVTSTIQDVVEEKVSLSLDTRRVVPIALTSAEIQNTLALKSWANRVLKPAVSSIAQSVESAFLAVAKNRVNNIVGTPGANEFDTDTMLAARQVLMENLVPQDGKLVTLMNSAAMRKAAGARKGYFNAQAEIAKQYKSGYIATADGFDWLENNLLPTLTQGADVAFSVEASVVAISNGMSTLGVDGVTSGATIKAGTVFTIASCYAVHPITKETLPYLQRFVVTADVTETAGNSVTLQISPSIYYTSTDPRKNVSTAPVDEDVCTVLTGSASTSYTHNLAYHPSAFRFASVPLVKPDGLDMVGQETVDGMTVRVLRDFDILTDKLIMRLDFLGGFTAVRPEWAVKITS